MCDRLDHYTKIQCNLKGYECFLQKKPRCLDARFDEYKINLIKGNKLEVSFIIYSLLKKAFPVRLPNCCFSKFVMCQILSVTSKNYGRIIVPSLLRTCQFDFVVIGYLAASFSLISTPIPGTSFTDIYPLFIVGQPEKTLFSLSEKWTASCIPKFHTAKSTCACAECPTGETSPGP